MGITPQEFERMKNRLQAGPAAAVVAAESDARARATLHQVIIGVDPSLRGTGFGVIRLDGPVATAMACGVIRCAPKLEHSRCLLRIVETLREVVRAHSPTVCAMEALFYAQNPQTALIMGAARGAALFCMAEAGLEIYEIAPRKVKQAVVGYGAAQKIAVATMVQRMLRLAEQPQSDAADALAVALAHAQSQGGATTAAKRI
jgi:crossover junction endodeoxyribonuclease RuvC